MNKRRKIDVDLQYWLWWAGSWCPLQVSRWQPQPAWQEQIRCLDWPDCQKPWPPQWRHKSPPAGRVKRYPSLTQGLSLHLDRIWPWSPSRMAGWIGQHGQTGDIFRNGSEITNWVQTRDARPWFTSWEWCSAKGRCADPPRKRLKPRSHIRPRLRWPTIDSRIWLDARWTCPPCRSWRWTELPCWMWF